FHMSLRTQIPITPFLTMALAAKTHQISFPRCRQLPNVEEIFLSRQSAMGRVLENSYKFLILSRSFLLKTISCREVRSIQPHLDCSNLFLNRICRETFRTFITLQRRAPTLML